MSIRGSRVGVGVGVGVRVRIIFFFFFFYSHLTPHSPTGMAGGKDYAGARRAKAGTY